MNNFFTQLETIKKDVSLSLARKDEVRKVISQFVYDHPAVSIPEIARHTIMQGSFYKKILFTPLTPMSTIAVITLVALLGGGTSFAAEGALPGDVLYPIKIVVNEEVRSALTLSSEAKAQWEAKRAERRLEEAAELALQDKKDMDVAVYAKLEQNFKIHADRAQERIEALEQRGNARGAVSLASDFEASLKAHEKILERLEHETENSAEVKSVTAKVEARIDTIREIRTTIETKIATNDGKPETKTAAEGKINAGSNFIAATRAYLEHRKEQLGTEAVAQAEARLAVADNTLLESKAKIEAGLYGEAFNLGNRAMRIAQETRTLIEANVNIKSQSHIQLRSSTEEEADTRNTEQNENRTEVNVRREGDTNIENDEIRGEGKLDINIGL